MKEIRWERKRHFKLKEYLSTNIFFVLARLRSIMLKRLPDVRCDPDLKFILSLFLLSRFLIFGAALLAQKVVYPSESFNIWTDLPRFFNHWDCNWYHAIASDGYSYTPGEPSTIHFFPLLPVLIKMTELITTLPFVWAAFIFTNSVFVFSLFILCKLAKKWDFKDKDVRFGVVLYCFQPFSCFYVSAFTETLFVALAALFFLTLENEKSRLLCFTFGFLSGLTRPNGFLLSASLLGSKTWKKAISSTAPMLGFLSFLAFLRYQFGSWTMYFENSALWGKSFSTITATIAYSYQTYKRADFYVFLLVPSIYLLLTILIAFQAKNIPRGVLLWCLSNCILIFCSGTLEGAPRFASVLFPCYFIMAQTASKPIKYAMLICFIGLNIYFSALFAIGEWLT